MKKIFSEHWKVMQDTFDLGEKYEFYKAEGRTDILNSEGGYNFQPNEWEEIPMLGHLQLMLLADPHYDRCIRQFNAAPWWYRLDFTATEAEIAMGGLLRFEHADYYCKVWLNGTFLGAHEGYSTPFSFRVDGLLRQENVLMVKVWSPNDYDVAADEKTDPRFLMAIRNMMKGTYEHGDSLIHRDRNPVGLYGEVSLTLFENALISERPQVDVNLREQGNAQIGVRVRVLATDARKDAVCRLVLRSLDDGFAVDTAEMHVSLNAGETEICMNAAIESPRLWYTWDRGAQPLYRAEISIDSMCQTSAVFGVRRVELERTEQTTAFHLNGCKIYVRGTSYYPETYLSSMTEGRYLRDLVLLKQCGCNMVRVHVHQEKQAFYDLCDKMGIAVMQDTDFNWVHPQTQEWTERAIKLVGEQEEELHNHPSIFSWVCLNEPVVPHTPEMGRYEADAFFTYCQPGPQLYELLSHRRKDCAVIRASFAEKDLLSGDSHNYKGSIDGERGHYLETDTMVEKFNTEFGFDAPPDLEQLWREPRIARRGGWTRERLNEIQYYQYRYLKFLVEHYRLSKNNPTCGHMSFMLIDCSPSTFYGVLDYSGAAKPGIRAFLESNQPIGLFYRALGENKGLWVVNDTPQAYRNCTLGFSATGENGEIVAQERIAIDVEADSIDCALAVALDEKELVGGELRICLRGPDGAVIAENVYLDPFVHPVHPSGHPWHFSHTYGLRLY